MNEWINLILMVITMTFYVMGMGVNTGIVFSNEKEFNRFPIKYGWLVLISWFGTPFLRGYKK